MSPWIIIIFMIAFFLRVFYLRKSKHNERQILTAGGKEYGSKNSRVIAILHTIFYISCVVEAFLRKSDFDGTSLLGFILLLFSMIMLIYVSHLLGSLWTVKLIIASHHSYNDHLLFRTIKHPNYYLNIIPELIGLALLCHAFWSLLFILPLYLIALFFRIQKEEQLLVEIKAAK